MKSKLLLYLLLILTLTVFGRKKQATLYDIAQPYQIKVSKNFIYVAVGYSIKIFNKNTFKYIKTIGRKEQVHLMANTCSLQDQPGKTPVIFTGSVHQ